MRVPGNLTKLLLQRQCVAFVGAGFSTPCGMPSWGGLLCRLLDDARSALLDEAQGEIVESMKRSIEQGKTLLAISQVRQLLRPVELNREIGKHFGIDVLHGASSVDQLRQLDRIRWLVGGPWMGVVTTNYDNLIEFGLGQYTKGNYWESSTADDNFGSILCMGHLAKRFFVKLHGSVTGGRYVLGTEEYDRVYLSDPSVTAFLTALMLRYHIVFIGCSIEDEILRIRRRLCLAFRGNIPPAYALLPRDADNLARRQILAEQAQILALLYDPRATDAAGVEHFEVDDFLMNAHALVDPQTEGTAEDPEKVSVHREMQRLELPERVRQIGAINRELLGLVRSGGDLGIAHARVVSLGFASELRPSAALSDLSVEERIYRILFLEAIGLVTTRKSPSGERQYIVPAKVAKVVASLDESIRR